VNARPTDRFEPARAVADAVLYEGYVLYPYRASSRKNQIRWQFGVLTPLAYSEVDSSERSSMRTECIVDPGADPSVAVRIRCLQVQHRGVEVATSGSTGEDHRFTPTETLVVGGETHVDWDEAVDRVLDLPAIDLSPLVESAFRRVVHEEPFAFDAWTDSEPICSHDGSVAGRIVRTRQHVAGRVVLEASRVAGLGRFVRVAVTVENATEMTRPHIRRDEVMGRSLVAVHTMLAIDGGAFVSLLDPPEEASLAAAGCRNDGTFPVLISGEDLVLSSPIILYDYPQVAPESPGDLYDSTEIDEILALRVMTLTDVEKAEARGTDPRAAAIIDRCDDMPPEIWDRLHGAMRSLSASRPSEPFAESQTFPEWSTPGAPGSEEDAMTVPWWDPSVDSAVDPWSDSLVVAGVEISKGDAVRLRPSHRSDAQDLFLHGMSATVAGVFKDVDGNDHVAVTIDDDPATDELAWQGRFLFFHPDEVEPCRAGQL
jgi:hypothetical protein